MYGIVSGQGMIGNVWDDAPGMWDRHRTLYGRVANADALKWIKKIIAKYEK